MPGLLKLALALGVCLDRGNNLGMGLHQFGISQHTSASWKVIKASSGQHQVFSGSSAAPSLHDAAMLMEPYGVSLLVILAIAQESHTRLKVVLVALFRQDHPTALTMRYVNTEIVERKIDLE